MTNTLACVSAQKACPLKGPVGVSLVPKGQKVSASSRNNIFFFSFQIHGFNNGWFQMPELIYYLTRPINHLFHEVLFSKLGIGWTLAETQLTS